MIEIKHPQQLTQLRRLCLTAQGLQQTQPYGQGLAGARKAINQLGYVQLDTISVIERAHHHVLYSRVPKFQPTMINKLLLNGDIFEYWSHAASVLPIADFRYSLPYKHAIKSGQTHWHKTHDKKLMAELLARIQSDGPLRSRDLESIASENTATRTGWWDWKPAKRALEQLYMEGDLMVSNREGFQKTYDLTERVLPAGIDSKMPSMEQFAAHMLEQQLRCHGAVSLKGLTYLRRSAELRKAIKVLVDEKIAQRTLESIQVSSGEVFIMEAGSLEHPVPRTNNRMQILSPFDNCVIQRQRLKHLFQYEYQLECYLPEAKRQYGYFCLPLLFSDQFIGRMDCKAHRKTGNFEVKSLYLEPHNFDQDAVISALVDAIKNFCHFQNCSSITLTKANPKHLIKILQQALTR
ncbi:winged helix-turn-helix domain-containing protein [Pelagibaculum spongiae]|uniref:Winged helix-turn-helix domain-containing protein n=1 Tax=Pelagibaculum spongiae TaxID=2080658 RepID=A0A2V1GY63_9GAMM|nr:crosslink repair DNA glycosylase YcaQ family protein [Pelagibaculum spongiae]PVZ66703.1 winged helix-turn-helix domain-containing protein [Pelagibaculum spongiae]